MAYKCLVCGKQTKTAKGMVQHLAATTTHLYGEHIAWVEANGLLYSDLTGEGSYAPFVELVEKKCKFEQ